MATDADKAQAELEFKYAVKLTEEMRTSSEQRWVHVRNRLREEGVSEKDAAMGALSPEDYEQMLGVVYSGDGRAFTFEFEFDRDDGPEMVRWEAVDPSDWPEEILAAQRVLKAG